MVDGIGKGGPPRGVGGTPPTTGPTKPAVSSPQAGTPTGKTFDVGKTREATAIETPANVNATGALEQLKAGKIDFNQYVDLKVDEATSHLEGLSPSQVDSIRSMLRDRMATDPELVDLVKQATGQAPSVPEE
jgi:hypothetical protein